jgi:hypothetical protein
MEWSKLDSISAQTQGWDVYEAWEDGAFHPVVQRHPESNIFTTDEAAREFVKVRAMASSNRCPVAHKAYAIVFRSQVGKKR